jgi:DNA-binding transcriptional LysR family regulator
VRIGDLGVESFIAHNVHSPSREKVIETFRKRETPLNITIEIATIETIKKFVAMNLGLAFVPLMCVQEEVARKELVVIPVEDFNHDRTLWLVRRRGDAQSHAAKAFLNLATSLGNQILRSAGSSEKTVSGKREEPARGVIN